MPIQINHYKRLQPFFLHRKLSSSLVLTFCRFLIIRPCVFAFLLFFFSLEAPRLSSAQQSPYFPERGSAAIFQRALDLQNLTVVLSIALEPGFEDLPTLTYLRMARGARVINLYVMNGEATPSDLNGEVPFRLAARRKEEAYRSIMHIGGETYFLNLPDAGVVTDRHKLERIWNPDAVVAKLAEAIRMHRPDVILISRDFRGEPGQTLRQRTLQDLLLNAVRAVQEPSGPQDTKASSIILPWKVQRIFVDRATSKQPFHVDIGLRHPIWKKTYRKIADEAEQNYESLRIHMKAWRRLGERSYTLLYPSSSKALVSLDQGLTLISPRLRGIGSAVARVARLAKTERSSSVLGPLSVVLDSVDRAIGWEASELKLTNLERRALVFWKTRLENLRCALLDVDLQFEVSDSLVTRSQLFFLKFKRFKAKITRGRTDILFPGVRRGNWAVNESLEYQFPLEVGKDYRILTLKNLEYNAPPAVYGLDRATIRTNFSFIIIHRDSLRERNFVCQKDIPLSVGPRLSTEIFTPIIFVTPSERLVYRFQNFTRDGVYGETFVEDSLARSDHKPFRLRTKDSSVIDTLALTWKDSLPSGDYVHELKISGESVGRFVARKFDVVIDTTRKVGLITELEGSPVAEALRRLRMPYIMLDTLSLKSSDFSSLATIVIDRDAEALRNDLPAMLPRLRKWVRAGGHLILFPQYSMPSENLMIQEELNFRLWPALDPESEVSVDTSHVFLTRPNLIQTADWQGWIFARSLGSVEVKGNQEKEVPIRSRDSDAPLVVTIKDGKGQMTYIALDLSSQLLNIRPGAHRLLANLLSYRYIYTKE